VVSTIFDGFDFDDNAVENGGFYFIPPDPIGAAGTDRVVAVVNAMIEARTKAGGLLWRDSLAVFFAGLTPANALFDPKVVYDHHEGRFLVVALEKVEPGIANPSPGNVSRVLLAVSKTATPASATGADWYYTAFGGKFVIAGSEYWSDYPGFEVDEEAVYITNNLFAFAPVAPGTYGGVRLWIVDKGVIGGFYGGGAAVVTVHDPYAGGGIAATTMPCLVYGAGGVGPGIGTFLVSYDGLSAGGAAAPEFVQVVRVDAPLGAVSFAREYVSIGDLEDLGGGFGFPDLPDAPQLGTATPIEVNDRRALDCVWRGSSIWLTTTINPNAGADVGETTAHWIRLDTSAIPAAITLSDQGDIGGEDIAAGTYTFFPALAVNGAGDAKFGFSASAGTIYAGAYVTGREAGDAAGTVQASETVKAGVDFYIRTFGGPRNRWGDYSGMALDPTNDGVFWTFNEYAKARGTVLSGEDGRWGTAWGSCSFTAPTTTTTTSTTSTTTTSGTMPSTTTTSSTTTTTTTSTSTTTTTLPPDPCSATPDVGCKTALKISFQIKDNATDDTKDQLKWKWIKGQTVAQGDLGNPDTTATYRLCIYDSTASVDTLVGSVTIDPNPSWQDKDPAGWKYVDVTLAEDGVQKAQLKTGDPDKAKAQVKARSVNLTAVLPLPVSATEFFDQDPRVTVQLVNNETPTCWTSEFTTATHNTPAQFKAKSP
jgi:hypothetical protein